jgi:hypothetical protein
MTLQSGVCSKTSNMTFKLNVFTVRVIGGLAIVLIIQTDATAISFLEGTVMDIYMKINSTST